MKIKVFIITVFCICLYSLFSYFLLYEGKAVENKTLTAKERAYVKRVTVYCEKSQPDTVGYCVYSNLDSYDDFMLNYYLEYFPIINMNPNKKPTYSMEQATILRCMTRYQIKDYEIFKWEDAVECAEKTLKIKANR